MKYPTFLPVKTNEAINAKAAKLAAAAGRNRSDYIRRLIQALAADPNLQQAVNQAIDGNRQ